MKPTDALRMRQEIRSFWRPFNWLGELLAATVPLEIPMKIGNLEVEELHHRKSTYCARENGAILTVVVENGYVRWHVHFMEGTGYGSELRGTYAVGDDEPRVVARCMTEARRAAQLLRELRDLENSRGTGPNLVQCKAELHHALDLYLDDEDEHAFTRNVTAVLERNGVRVTPSVVVEDLVRFAKMGPEFARRQIDAGIEHRGVAMTPEEKEEQRRSFAFGNANISNPNVTREMVDQAADEMDRAAAELPERVGVLEQLFRFVIVFLILLAGLVLVAVLIGVPLYVLARIVGAAL